MPRLTSQQGSPTAVLRLIDKPIADMTDQELEQKLEALRAARLSAGAKTRKRSPVGNAPTPKNKDGGWVDEGEEIL